MATHEDIGVPALFNTIGAIGFLLAFALLRIQPIYDRVYFPKWYIVGKRTTLNIWTYFTILIWMPQALKMSESDCV